MSKNVPAIPPGYHSITPYLIQKEARKAIDFYKNAFGAKEIMCMDGPDGRVAHAELQIGDSKIMLADENEEMGAKSPKSYGGSPVGLHLYVENVDAIFDKASSLGAKIIWPVMDKFYGDRSGTLQDPFGHQWTISTHIEDVTADEMKQRMTEFES